MHRRECGCGLFQDIRTRNENISDHDNWLQLSNTDLLTLTLTVQFVVTRNSSRGLPRISRDLYSAPNVQQNEELQIG